MNILLVNWHEPFIYNLSKIGHFFYIIEPQVLGLKRMGADEEEKWRQNIRPFPENANNITNIKALKECLKSNKIDLSVAFTYLDIAFLKYIDIPKIFFPLTSLNNEFNQYPPEYKNIMCECISPLFQDIYPAYLAPSFMKKELGGWGTDGYIFNASAGVDHTEYYSYTGEIPSVIRVGNHLKIRNFYNYDIQSEVFKDIPHLILGINPGIENSRAAENWEDLKNCLQKYRVFFATYDPNFQEMFAPMSQLEAMATGMPVVATPHPKSIIVDGENGFVSDDPAVLREKILLLLNNHELAKRLGEKARQTVINLYGFDKYKTEWEYILREAIKIHTPILKNSQGNNKTIIEWEGPYRYSHPFGAINSKIIQSLEKNGVSIIPIPKEPKYPKEILLPHIADSIKQLEILGKSLLIERAADIKVISPIQNSNFDPLIFQESNIPIILYCDLDQDQNESLLTVKKLLQTGKIQEIWVRSMMEKRLLQTQQGIPENKMLVVPQGIDSTTLVSDSSPYDTCDKNFTFLFIGNPSPKEGLNTVSTAFVNEFKASEDVSLILACPDKVHGLNEYIKLLNRESQITVANLHTLFFLNNICKNVSFAIIPYTGISSPRFLMDITNNNVPFAATGFGGALDMEEWGTIYFIPTQLAINENDSSSYQIEIELLSLQKIMRYAFEHKTEIKINALIAKKKGIDSMQWDLIAKNILQHIKLENIETGQKKYFPILSEKEYKRNFLIHKAALSLLLNEWESAHSLILEVLSIYPNDILAKAMLIESKAVLKDKDTVNLIEDLLNNNKDKSIFPHLLKASIYIENRSIYERLLVEFNDIYSQLLTIRILVECGRKKEAGLLCTKNMSQSNDPVVAVAKAILIEKEEPWEARLLYEQAIEIDYMN